MALSTRHLDRTARPGTCRAFTLVEVTITLVLVGTAFGIIANLLVRAHHRGRLSDQRRMAQAVAHEVLETMVHRPWDEIADGEPPPTDADVAEQLPGLDVDVTVAPADDADARRISVSVGWDDDVGVAVEPVRLVTWVHRDGRPR